MSRLQLPHCSQIQFLVLFFDVTETMHTIGLTGGSSLCELGTVADVSMFFECIRIFVLPAYPSHDWTLVTERLYKRYLDLHELDQASMLLCQAKEIFSDIPVAAVEWASRIAPGSRLNLTRGTLSDVFAKYFESLSHCIEAAKINYEGFKSFPGYSYEAVRLVISDQPWFINEKMRPLAEYDALEGTPFWMV